ncbi:MAG: hypothetical protein JJU10_05880 [Idiomarina sp.]|nr:hypothetical protein [Idiomarina sp.]
MEIDGSMLSAFQSAQLGMQRASNQVSDASQSIARNAAEDTGALVDLISGERSFEANVASLEAADRMLGRIIDIEA